MLATSNKLNLTNEEEPPKTLYHYTTGAGLIGIVEKQSLWSTHVAYMNDATEFLYAIKIAISTIQQLKNNSKEDSYHEFCDILIDFLGSDLFSEANLFIACFSAASDSLSLWRGYCQGNLRYNIGFDRKKLAKIATHKEAKFELSPCIYDKEKQEKIIHEWAYCFLEKLNSSCSKTTSATDHFYNKFSPFIKRFIKFSAYIKHPDFYEEREWRLVGFIADNNENIALRQGQSFLIPYYTIKLDFEPSASPICEVCVGPTPNPILAENSVRRLLRKMMHKISMPTTVKKTNIPYRDW